MSLAMPRQMKSFKPEQTPMEPSLQHSSASRRGCTKKQVNKLEVGQTSVHLWLGGRNIMSRMSTLQFTAGCTRSNPHLKSLPAENTSYYAVYERRTDDDK